MTQLLPPRGLPPCSLRKLDRIECMLYATYIIACGLYWEAYIGVSSRFSPQFSIAAPRFRGVPTMFPRGSDARVPNEGA